MQMHLLFVLFRVIIIIANKFAFFKIKSILFANNLQIGGVCMVDLNTLSPEERQIVLAKRKYHREWRAANRDKVREINKRFYKNHFAKNSG